MEEEVRRAALLTGEDAQNFDDSVDTDVEFKARLIKPITKSSSRKIVLELDDGQKELGVTESRAKELFSVDDTTSNLDPVTLEKVKGHKRLARLLQFIEDQKEIDLSESQAFFADLASVHTVPGKSLYGWMVSEANTQRRFMEGKSYREIMDRNQKKGGFFGWLGLGKKE